MKKNTTDKKKNLSVIKGNKIAKSVNVRAQEYQQNYTILLSLNIASITVHFLLLSKNLYG